MLRSLGGSPSTLCVRLIRVQVAHRQYWSKESVCPHYCTKILIYFIFEIWKAIQIIRPFKPSIYSCPIVLRMIKLFKNGHVAGSSRLENLSRFFINRGKSRGTGWGKV